MKKFSLFKKIVNKEVTCALCLAKAEKEGSTRLYDGDVCKWCADYYSKAFPNDWKEQVRPLLL